MWLLQGKWSIAGVKKVDLRRDVDGWKIILLYGWQS